MDNEKRKWVKSAFNEINDTKTGNQRITRSTTQSTRKRRSSNSVSNVKNETKTVRKTNVQANKHAVCDQQTSWMEVFAPKTCDDLAVHAKKISAVKEWLQQSKIREGKTVTAAIGLLTGPTGSGKTATLRVLAEEEEFFIQEWINPVEQEMIYTLGDQQYDSHYVSSQMNAFRSFLFKASRYRSLLQPVGHKRLLLVEDLPNFLFRDSALFVEILEEYQTYGASPLVLIITDAKSRHLNINYQVFTNQLKEKLAIKHFSFNAISTTLMQKSMKRFCKILETTMPTELYKLPSDDIIQSVIVTSQGDVRNALNNLHFAALKGCPGISIEDINVKPTVLSNKKRPTKKRKADAGILTAMNTNESITLIHALGRVFNPKYTEDKRLLHSPETLTENFDTDAKVFTDLLHTNYLQHFRELDHLVAAANDLSLCELLLKEYRDNILANEGLNIITRSLMVNNLQPINGWLPVIPPKRFIKNQYSHANNITSSIYATDYATYVKHINPK